ncbi:MAG: hypothetical protein HY360_03270 [Verrucomicrobia bacterium]|nr:hypothetical protein [Verrucomicrobiota bacterium]
MGRSKREALIEAVLTVKDPLVIGLLSMFANTDDLSEIEAVIGRLRRRGMDILGLKREN